MTHQQRIAVTRIFADLIKADAIIDAGEMDMYARIVEEYGITRAIECAATEMTLADAVHIMSKAGIRLRQQFVADCSAMTVSDGFCAPQEALLMMALRQCVGDDGDGSAEVISAYEPDLRIEANQVIYVESRYSERVNDEVRRDYRNIVNMFRLAGFNFIYIPYVANHYKQYESGTFVQVANFLAPNLSSEELLILQKNLTGMTTVQFCKEQLCARLGMTSLHDAEPSVLIKISSNYVSNHLYGNFLRVEVDREGYDVVQKLMDSYVEMLSSDLVMVSHVDESKGRFLYHGFYKQLFDMYTIRQGQVCTIEINPYQGVIRLPEINKNLEGLRRKEKALYVLLLLESKRGGISFSQPENARQLAAFNQRMKKVMVEYNKIYEMFGGEKNAAPDIALAEIRKPMISNIRKSVKLLQNDLRNAEDYTIRKDGDGVFSIPIDNKMVKILTINGFVEIENANIVE